MIKLLWTALLAAVTATASAGTVDRFTLPPAIATPGEAVRLRIDGAQGCYRMESAQVSRDERFIEVRRVLSDIGQCAPSWITPIFLELGTFTPAAYEVSIVECVFACPTREILPLRVAGQFQPQARVIPALSAHSLALLMVAMLALVALAASRHRRR